MISTKHDQIVRLINKNLREVFFKRSMFCEFLVDRVEDGQDSPIIFAPRNIYALHYLSKGKVFVLHVYNHKKEICNYICKRFGLKFMENSYRKQYLCFETDNLDNLLTLCTLICKD